MIKSNRYKLTTVNDPHNLKRHNTTLITFTGPYTRKAIDVKNDKAKK